MNYALRFDTPHTEALSFIDLIHKKLKNLTKFLWVKEISTKEKKEHIHGFVSCDKITTTIRDLVRKQKWYKDGCYSISTVKNYNKYNRYICKDMKILKTNYPEDELDNLIEEAQRIKMEKQMTLIDKLEDYIYDGFIDDEKEIKTFSNNDLLDKILDYYTDKKNKDEFILLPNRNQMFQYVCTLQARRNNKTSLALLYHNVV